jgi:hypothetical protein
MDFHASFPSDTNELINEFVELLFLPGFPRGTLDGPSWAIHRDRCTVGTQGMAAVELKRFALQGYRRCRIASIGDIVCESLDGGDRQDQREFSQMRAAFGAG